MAGRRPINWIRLRSDEAERILHEWSAQSGNVRTTIHALDRVGERREHGTLNLDDVFKILRTGMVIDPPFLNELGHWQCKIVKRILGERVAGVVTVILHREKRLIVRTVEWEDRL